MSDFVVTILNWTKYNPRKERAAHSWFRMEAAILTSQDLFDMTPAQKWAWVGLMSLACRSSGEPFSVNPKWLSHESGVEVQDILGLFDHLETKKLITLERPKTQPVTSGTHAVTSGARLSHYERTNERTNETNVTASTEKTELKKAIRTAYLEAYASRYGKDPVFNAKVNSQIKQLAERLGRDGPHVVAFYLTHSDSFYVRQAHAFGPLLANAEALHTQWTLGQKITGTQAREIERSESSQVSEAEMSSLLGRTSERIVTNDVKLLKAGNDD